MRLQHFKGITAYICERLKWEVTEAQVRAWADRKSDPLPTDPFAGSMGANSEEIDAWIERNKGKRQVRRRGEAQPVNPTQLQLLRTS